MSPDADRRVGERDPLEAAALEELGYASVEGVGLDDLKPLAPLPEPCAD